jgi:hypothetical protein
MWGKKSVFDKIFPPLKHKFPNSSAAFRNLFMVKKWVPEIIYGTKNIPTDHYLQRNAFIIRKLTE